MNNMNDKGKMKDGFTLVELMVVICVIGLLAVVSLPAYPRFMQNWKLNGDTQEFVCTLRTARSSAVMKNIDVVFTFDMNTDTYWYFEDEDRNGLRDKSEFRSATYELSPGIEIAAHTLTATTFTFGSKGNTRESGTITIQNAYNKNKGVRIFGGTGNITVD